MNDATGARWAQKLQGHVTVPPPAITYRIGALLVAFTMVLLPVLYVAIIVLVARGVMWYATHATGVFGHVRGRAMIVAVAVYVGPLIAGAVLVAFMIKPLFARRVRSQANLTLQRQENPDLFEFVDRVALLVGAPQPRQICVDTQSNASAGFRRGWLSFFGNDLTLTIGMPLVANLTVQQFAGVLAHEFGHFSQGGGMRLSYIIRQISFWLYRVVYERDQWDAKLEEIASSDSHWAINLVGHISRLAVWLSRRVLWVLMWVGSVVSGFMMRQMEYDADRYEIAVAGSKAFEQTSDVLPMLGASTQAAYHSLQNSFRERKLADDVCSLIGSIWGEMPAEVRKAIEKHNREQKTGLFDSHPSNRDRVGRAKRAALPRLPVGRPQRHHTVREFPGHLAGRHHRPSTRMCWARRSTRASSSRRRSMSTRGMKPPRPIRRWMTSLANCSAPSGRSSPISPLPGRWRRMRRWNA